MLRFLQVGFISALSIILGVFSPAPNALATFSQSSNSPSFTDVPPNSTFYDEINWLVDQGITSGYGDGTFRPKNEITREAIAAFLYRAAGEPYFEAPIESDFSDVPTTAPFYDEISWLVDQGITVGYGDGTFRPKNKITREAVAAFLYRAEGEPHIDLPENARFVDVPKTSNYFPETYWLVTAGMTTGYADGTFRPKNLITREAMAAFLYRVHVEPLSEDPYADVAQRRTSDALSLINQYRADANVAPLSKSSCAEEAAIVHAHYMATTGDFEHQDLYAVIAQCPGTNRAGENIAWGYHTDAAVMQGWYNSPGHRAILLNPSFTKVGLALVYAESGRPYWVQVFL